MEWETADRAQKTALKTLNTLQLLCWQSEFVANPHQPDTIFGTKGKLSGGNGLIFTHGGGCHCSYLRSFSFPPPVSAAFPAGWDRFEGLFVKVGGDSSGILILSLVLIFLDICIGSNQYSELTTNFEQLKFPSS